MLICRCYRADCYENLKRLPAGAWRDPRDDLAALNGVNLRRRNRQAPRRREHVEAAGRCARRAEHAERDLDGIGEEEDDGNPGDATMNDENEKAQPTINDKSMQAMTMAANNSLIC